MYSEAAGIHRIIPAAVAVAANHSDVALLLRWARDAAVPITARGSGSSMAGGAVGPGLLLDLSRLNAVGDVDAEGRSVTCEPGALRDDVDRAARARGLRFPVDPSSGKFCTLGGMVATNAAGAHSLGFGATCDWITAVECAFADGTSAMLRRGQPPPEHVPTVARALTVLESCRDHAAAFQRAVRKDSSGYGIGRWLRSGDILDVIVGSEGTLALVTVIEVRLAPAAPMTSSVLAAFAGLQAAAEGARAAREAGAVVCELLDATFLEIAKEGSAFAGLPPRTSAVLLAELEGVTAAAVGDRASALERSFEHAGALVTKSALVPAAERQVWELRHAASPLLAELSPSLRSVQVIEDGAVPPDSLAEYVRALRRELAIAGTRAVIFGHAGDAHVHVNPLVDVTRSTWRADLERLLSGVTDAVAGLGGTLTGEHGDGRLRAPLLARTWPAVAMQKFAELKQAFDPDGLLNPGVKLPLPGQRPLENVKYDPELEPLPAAARAALDRIAAERCYAAARLSLLDVDS